MPLPFAPSPPLPLSQVLVPLLELFGGQMRARLEMSRVATREVGSWAAVGAIAHVLAYVVPVMLEWQETEPIAAMARERTDSTAAAAPAAAPADADDDDDDDDAPPASPVASRGRATQEPTTPGTMMTPHTPQTPQTPPTTLPSPAAALDNLGGGGSSKALLSSAHAVASLARSATASLASTAKRSGARTCSALASAAASMALAGGATAAPPLSGPLSPVLDASRELLRDCEAAVVETVTTLFESSCRPYLGTVRDFRLMSHDAAASIELLDLSPPLCEPLAMLHAELNGMRASLPPASLRRVWPPIATAVDTLLYSQLVRRAAFSAGGARQLLRDVSALAALFVPLAARPQAALRRLHESCSLLVLPRELRVGLVDAILAETPLQQRRAEHEASLRRRLEEHGVFRLSLGEAAEILASVHDDEAERG